MPRKTTAAFWLQHSQGAIQIGFKHQPGNGRVFNRPTPASIRRIQRLGLRLAARDNWTCHPTLACGPTDWLDFGWVCHRPKNERPVAVLPQPRPALTNAVDPVLPNHPQRSNIKPIAAHCQNDSTSVLPHLVGALPGGGQSWPS